MKYNAMLFARLAIYIKQHLFKVEKLSGATSSLVNLYENGGHIICADTGIRILSQYLV